MSIVILLWSQGLEKRSTSKRPKNVHFVGTSSRDLRALPKGARAVFGYAILLAENGMKHPDAKPLKGFGGAGVLEVVEDLDGDTYRAVYAVKFGDTVYVLHAFKKKSKVGSKTPPRDMELITKRFKEAEEHYRENHAPKKKKTDEQR
jgi:phage-related protein